MPEIEKVLVDIYCDTDLFAFLSGEEWEKIWGTAASQYVINKTRLLRYASRRGRQLYFQNLLKTAGEK